MSTSNPEVAIIEAIHTLYNEELTEEERELVPDLEAGEWTQISVNQIKPAAKLIREENSRYAALIFLFQNFKHNAQFFDKYVPMLMIEMLEEIELVQEDRHHTCVIRACSFYDQYFGDLVDGSRLYDRINNAYEEGILDSEEKRLFHFVRQVRNDCGHNAWVEKQTPYEILEFAADSAMFLNDRLMNEKLQEYGSSSRPEIPDEIKSEDMLRRIESVFGWEYDEDDDYWERKEIDYPYDMHK